MSEAYFLIGPPGCGKSTWCAKFLEDHENVLIVSTDAMFDELAKNDNITYNQAFDKYRDQYANLIKKGRTAIARAAIENHIVIIDQTNCTTMDRKAFKSAFPASYKKIGVIFDFDPVEIKKRVKARQELTGKYVPAYFVNRCMDNFEPPFPHEFDEIIIIPQ